ncbi:MAG TPA: exodeoxyribonuclease VII large subunit [Bacillales bacterium]|nr:exodeoxyribonuclease VII large subunit [Bacillales bacterium]
MNDADRYMTVTALTRSIKRLFEKEPKYRNVWVRGELSNFKHHSRGHMYFTLKDNQSRIQSVMFSSQNRSLRFRPEDGMKVLVRGEVSVYEPYGQYQLYAKEIQPDGVGNLYLAFEELKRKLEQEGLFAVAHKKTLPTYATEIGVVTSPTGAALRDICTTIKRRYPAARITVFPALVQGTAAAASVADAIKQANLHSFLDVLIIGRGGGSIEELWAFNEEIVARAIFRSRLPIISAVGHETDYTISDFVSDVRAPTPTAAAELAVPHVGELRERINERIIRMKRAMNERMQTQRARLQRLESSYAFRSPAQTLREKEQALDQCLERLTRNMRRQVENKSYEWRNTVRVLSKYHPQQAVKDAFAATDRVAKQLRREMNQLLVLQQNAFRQTVSKLNVLSPLNVMERGFSLTYGKDKQLIQTVHQVQPGDLVNVRLKDGTLDCQVWGIEEGETQ